MSVTDTTDQAGLGGALLPLRGGAAASDAAPPDGLVAARHPQRDYWRRRLLATADCICLTLTLLAAVSLVPDGASTVGVLPWALVLIPGWIVVFKLYGLYDRDLKRIAYSTVDDIPWLAHALLVGALTSWLFLKLSPAEKPALLEMIVFGALAFGSLLVTRSAVRQASHRFVGPEKVLLIGDDGEGMHALVRKLERNPRFGLQPVGVLGECPELSKRIALPCLGSLRDLDQVTVSHGIERVVIAPQLLGEGAEQIELLRRCRQLALKVTVLPRVFDAMGPAVSVDDVEGITVLGLNPPVLSPSSRFLKRALDLIGTLTVLFLAAPAMLLIALLITFDSPGPVLFRQRRIGRGGKPFNVIKFRTMVPDAEARAAELRKLSKDPSWLHLEHDPRITRVGRFLRMTSLDELPQLWNVVRGEMSLVGPRPLIESEDELVNGWGRRRLELTPGITGLWQVLGRTNIPFDEMVKLDYLYVANWSVWGDVRLILRTVPVVVARRGAN